MTDDYIKRLEERIARLEEIGLHCSSAEDRRLDNLLRKIAKSVELTAWLGTWCIKVAPVVAVVWFLGDEAMTWFQSVISRSGGNQ